VTETIVDNLAGQRYEMIVEGLTCYLAYQRADGLLTFLHTVVPDALSGRGFAAQLTQRALQDARANGEKVIPRCSYSAAYIRKHPEYQDLVAA
jgi:uncharacterized protein